jgi:uncharacterized surface protein with fasciclin (FAS1) repeats
MRTTAALFMSAVIALGACSSDDDDSADTAATEAGGTTASQAGSTSTSAATTTVVTTTAKPATTTTGSTARTTTSTTKNTTPDASVTTDDSDSTTDVTVDETTDATADGTTDATSIEDRLNTVEQALRDGDFTIMLEALNLSGVADEIEQKQVTILAPTDDAFGKLAVGDYADLLTNAGEMRDLVSRYIIDEVLTYDELSKRTEVTTVSGETLTVTFEGGVLEVDGGVVTEMADGKLNGEKGQEVAVFAIDKVLLEAG